MVIPLFFDVLFFFCRKPNMRSPFELSITTNSPHSNGVDIRKRNVKKDKMGIHQLHQPQPQDNDILSPVTISSSGGESSTNSADIEDENDKFTLVPSKDIDNISKSNRYQYEKENKQHNKQDVTPDSPAEEYKKYKESYFKKSIRNNHHQPEQDPTPTNKNDKRHVDVSDIAFGELHSDDFFSGTGATTFENSLPATPEKENIHIETAATETALQQFENFTVDEEKSKEPNSNEDNSFDVFEASFQTAFPSSFAQTPSEPSLSLDEIFSDSNSFFASSDNSLEKSQSSKERESSTEQVLFPDTFGDHIPAPKTISTPSKDKPLGGDCENLEPPAPPSEKQTGGAAARARYKYALADPDENIAPMDEAEADRSETSPSLVLQRLQQRKKIEKMTSNSIASPDGTGQNANNRTSRSSISEEIRRLDAIANGTYSPQPMNTISGNRRRNVKQPISYAEPTLKSKLRRGDVFFPKGDVIDKEANTETTVTS